MSLTSCKIDPRNMGATFSVLSSPEGCELSVVSTSLLFLDVKVSYALANDMPAIVGYFSDAK
jgi:hypothetical protein